MALNDLEFDLATTGTPVEGGSVYIDLTGTATAPSNASTTLGTGWVSLGEESDQGYTIKHSMNSTTHRGWHGKPIITDITDETNTFSVEFVEVNRGTVAKLRFGSGNVTTNSNGEVTAITAKSGAITSHPMVFEELESNGWKRRTYFPDAIITSIDDEPHRRGDLLVWGMTFTANEDDTNGAYRVFRSAPTGATGQS